MVYGPASLVVLLIVVGLLAIGIHLLRSNRKRAMRRRAQPETELCPRCRHRNPAEAAYCAHCGQALEERH